MGDFYLEFVGVGEKIFLVEGVGELCGELIVEWYGIVIVYEDEMGVDGKFGLVFED